MERTVATANKHENNLAYPFGCLNAITCASIALQFRRLGSVVKPRKDKNPKRWHPLMTPMSLVFDVAVNSLANGYGLALKASCVLRDACRCQQPAYWHSNRHHKAVTPDATPVRDL